MKFSAKKKGRKHPLATRNTAVRSCHKIKKGVNEMSAMKQAAKSKTCKCLTGWKKSVNKATGRSECNKVSIFTSKYYLGRLVFFST